jgi:hypothetical protein
MDFPFDNFNQFSVQNASPSCKTLTLTNHPQKFYRHKPCSYYSIPYHGDNNCPSWGQFLNFSYGQMNTIFSNSGCDSNFNFYNPNWSNRFDFSWSTQATRNYAYQFDEMHHSDYPQFDHQAQSPAYQVPQIVPQSSLEDTLKAFMQSIDKILQSNKKDMQGMNRSSSQVIYKS